MWGRESKTTSTSLKRASGHSRAPQTSHDWAAKIQTEMTLTTMNSAGKKNRGRRRTHAQKCSRQQGRGNVDANIDRATERRNQGAGGLWARPPVLTPVPTEGVPQPRDKKSKLTMAPWKMNPRSRNISRRWRMAASQPRQSVTSNEKCSKMSKVRDSSERPKRSANQARRGALQCDKQEGKNIDL